MIKQWGPKASLFLFSAERPEQHTAEEEQRQSGNAECASGEDTVSVSRENAGTALSVRLCRSGNRAWKKSALKAALQSFARQ